MPYQQLLYFQFDLYAIQTVALLSVLTLSQTTILHYSKSKEFADDNFKFDENNKKFSKHVENTEGKGEIARYEQFLLLPQCFQKTPTADT